MKIRHILFALVLSFLLPLDAMAQACFGVPVAQGKSAAYAAIGLPDHATHLQIGGAVALSEPFALGAEFTHTSLDHGLGSANAIDLTGAYRLQLDESSPLSICPLGSFGFRSFDGANVISFGAGAGFSGELPISDGAYKLYPYAAPRLVHLRSEGESLTKLAFALGANFGINNYYIGAQFSRISGAGVASDAFYGGGFRLQAGLNF